MSETADLTATIALLFYNISSVRSTDAVLWLFFEAATVKTSDLSIAVLNCMTWDETDKTVYFMNESQFMQNVLFSCFLWVAE